MSYQWYLTRRRQELVGRVKEIAKREGKDLSRLLEELLEKYLEMHEETHNPQTSIADYQDPGFRALPNLWTIDSLGDFDGVDTKTVQEIYEKGGQVERLARRRLQMRGEL